MQDNYKMKFNKLLLGIKDKAYKPKAKTPTPKAGSVAEKKKP